jgi:hypothetical protein
MEFELLVHLALGGQQPRNVALRDRLVSFSFEQSTRLL